MQKISIAVMLAFTAGGVGANDEQVRQAVSPFLDASRAIQVSETPLRGIKAVRAGLDLIYVSEDGRYVIGGPIVDTHEARNLTEQALNQARADVMQAHRDSTPLFDFPATESRYEVVVFTDLDCGYCRRLHANLDDYHAAGVSLRYVMLPRAGIDSASYQKTVHAACAENPEQAITEAMTGAEPVALQCEHPIGQHMALARAMRINMTPMLLLEDGRLLKGAYPPADLLAELQK